VAQPVSPGIPVLVGVGSDHHHLKPRVIRQQPAGDLQRVLRIVRHVHHGHRRMRSHPAQPPDLVEAVGAAVGEPDLEGGGLRQGSDAIVLLQLQRRVAGPARHEHLQQLEEEVLFGTEEDDAGVHGTLPK
jgi:hypothetical protein